MANFFRNTVLTVAGAAMAVTPSLAFAGSKKEATARPRHAHQATGGEKYSKHAKDVVTSHGVNGMIADGARVALPETSKALSEMVYLGGAILTAQTLMHMKETHKKHIAKAVIDMAEGGALLSKPIRGERPEMASLRIGLAGMLTAVSFEAIKINETGSDQAAEKKGPLDQANYVVLRDLARGNIGADQIVNSAIGLVAMGLLVPTVKTQADIKIINDACNEFLVSIKEGAKLALAIAPDDMSKKAYTLIGSIASDGLTAIASPAARSQLEAKYNRFMRPKGKEFN